MEISEFKTLETKFGVSFTGDDPEIVDYLCDRHGKEILKTLQDRPENTGVSLFFDKDEDCKDLVLVMRLRNFPTPDDNGLTLFIVYDLHRSPEAKDALKDIIKQCFDANRDLRDAIIQNIEKLTVISIEKNA